MAVPEIIEFGSMLLGREPQGCVQCRRGAKMVLLVTGLCPFHCFYCPLSEKKKDRDVIYANERKVREESDVIEEARSISAEGTGITGGDPLFVLERTLHYIWLLKEEFGQEHHIHLYTGTTPTLSQLEALKEAGLDEIRYHLISVVEGSMKGREKRLLPYIEAIQNSINAGLTTGVEIPVIPGTLKALKWLVPELENANTRFLNLNELEFSPTNYEALLDRGIRVRDDISSAAEGSMETAYSLLEWAGQRGTTMAIHFCSSQYKDAGQLRRRLKRRAENTALPHEIITDDATFIKGVIEFTDTGESEDALMTDVRDYAAYLKENYEIPDEFIHIDEERHRIELAPWVLEEIADELIYPAFIVEEYPTADRLEVERRPVRSS